MLLDRPVTDQEHIDAEILMPATVPLASVPLPFSESPRVIARFAAAERARAQELIRRVLKLDAAEVSGLVEKLKTDYSARHQGFEAQLLYHFHQILQLMPKSQAAHLTPAQKLLLGAYFTQETPLESGGLSHPCLLPDAGHAHRLICCFQALSQEEAPALVFRQFDIDGQGLHPLPVEDKVMLPALEEFPERPRGEIEPLLARQGLSTGLRKQLLRQLQDPFVYADLFQVIDQLRLNCSQSSERRALQELLEAVDDYYDLSFGPSPLSSRVLGPLADQDLRGFADARFVRFSDEAPTRYLATYTANNQEPRLLTTSDFAHFRSFAVHAPSATQLALFPRKIRGRYAMLAQLDHLHFCLYFSDRLTHWQQPLLIQEPERAWELGRLGNCGAPIETAAGWLVVTEGLGPMGKVGLSACLLDRDDPTRLIGRLKEPLILPGLHACDQLTSAGSLVLGSRLLIPCALRHRPPQLLSVPLAELLARLTHP